MREPSVSPELVVLQREVAMAQRGFTAELYTSTLVARRVESNVTLTSTLQSSPERPCASCNCAGITELPGRKRPTLKCQPSFNRSVSIRRATSTGGAPMTPARKITARTSSARSGGPLLHATLVARQIRHTSMQNDARMMLTRGEETEPSAILIAG